MSYVSLAPRARAFSQIVIEIAGCAAYNTFGSYDPLIPSRRVQLSGGKRRRRLRPCWPSPLTAVFGLAISSWRWFPRLRH